MKAIKNVRVNFLRVYPTERETVSSVNGVKGTRAGALVLMDTLPKSEGQSDNNAIELSGKQLNNLASMHGIRSIGREAWNDLSIYIGVGKSVAVLSCEEHKADDKYIDKDGVEQSYTKTSTFCNVDSVVLPDRVSTALIEKTIEKNINWKDQDDVIDSLLKGAGISAPALEGVK